MSSRPSISRRTSGPDRPSLSLRFRIIDTPAGHVAYLATDRGLRGVYLPTSSVDALRRRIRADEPAATEDHSLLPGLARDLHEYFRGTPVRFRVPFDWSGATPFQQRVWRACAAIGHGKTASYKTLASRAGKPRASRAVGAAMGANRCPIVVPCHRVLRSDGSIGGYSGPGGVNFKQQLLELERGVGMS